MMTTDEFDGAPQAIKDLLACLDVLMEHAHFHQDLVDWFGRADVPVDERGPEPKKGHTDEELRTACWETALLTKGLLMEHLQLIDTFVMTANELAEVQDQLEQQKKVSKIIQPGLVVPK